MYEVKPRFNAKAARKALDENHFKKDFYELPSFGMGTPQPADNEVRSSIEFAESLKRKMKIN